MNPLASKKFKTKDEIRKAIWAYMEKENLTSFPRPCYGRIPNFIGVEKAVNHLIGLKEWSKAKTIFAAPDAVLFRVRLEALKEGKALLVAAPRLTGFYLLQNVPLGKAFLASRIKGFSKFGQKVEINSNLPKIDLYITGAVACDKKGNRIGKGAGYGDREDEILSKACLIDEKTPRIAIIHEIQLLEDFSFLVSKEDRKVSIVITPEKVYRLKFFL